MSSGHSFMAYWSCWHWSSLGVCINPQYKTHRRHSPENRQPRPIQKARNLIQEQKSKNDQSDSRSQSKALDKVQTFEYSCFHPIFVLALPSTSLAPPSLVPSFPYPVSVELSPPFSLKACYSESYESELSLIYYLLYEQSKVEKAFQNSRQGKKVRKARKVRQKGKGVLTIQNPAVQVAQHLFPRGGRDGRSAGIDLLGLESGSTLTTIFGYALLRPYEGELELPTIKLKPSLPKSYLFI